MVDYYITSEVGNQHTVNSSIALVSATDFSRHENLREEFFGPFALIVKCKDKQELRNTLSVLNGQLTATIIGAENELSAFSEIIEILKNKAGRVLFNGVPTGVEVCYSMHHGGPFPASSALQFTSVGADAIKRFVRPLCLQAWPQSQLPAELKNENPKHISRRVNGQQTTDAIIA